MKNFALLVKPVSCSCNLRCAYCFYLPRAKYLGSGPHLMTRESLQLLIRRYAACGLERCHFGWQGGEPTLAGLDFFREAIRCQKALFHENAKIVNALQTNGTLLDDQWADFLARNRFLTGISIDGPREVHDANRRNAQGGATYDKVIRGLEALKAAHADVNVLTLVSADNAHCPEDIYLHLCGLGVTYHQYIECVETDSAGGLLPFAVTAHQWGEFLCRLFDVWYAHDTSRVSIRLFDSLVSRLATGVPTVCPMNGDCRNYFVVEHDLSVYPCDFYVSAEHRLGNLMNDSFKSLQANEMYVEFGRAKKPCSQECMECRWLPLCMGDCQKNRKGTPRSLLCEGWKMFFEHAISRLELLATSIANERKA